MNSENKMIYQSLEDAIKSNGGKKRGRKNVHITKSLDNQNFASKTVGANTRNELNPILSDN